MYSKSLISLLTFLAVLFVLYVIYKKWVAPTGAEGFSQSSSFVLEQNDAIYDIFYAEVYDRLMLSEDRTSAELRQVIEMTQPSLNQSTFLDAGCGTGFAVKFLSDTGYKVYGCDKSQAMIDKAIITVGSANSGFLIKGDILDPMLYERNMFSHILCTYYTIYEIEDKREFFRNCYYWMKPGGYLILHLVDRDNFSPIIPAGRPPIVDNIQSYSNRRITDTIIDFTDFKYVANYKETDGPLSSDAVTVRQEAFTDKISGAVRQNEQVLYMNSTEEILKLAIKCGFLIKGKAVLSGDACGKDAHQYLYILERTL